MPHRHSEHHHNHHGLHPVKLHLSHAQVLKAKAGHPIQVKYEHIGHGHLFHLHPETHKKILHAHKHHKGARIHITHHELHGAGFLDVIKKIASPVLSGLSAVAGEILPQYKDTIGKVREGIRTATGYGLKPKKQMHHGNAMHSEQHGFMHGDGIHPGPKHFVGEHSDHYGFGIRHKKKTTKKHKGNGIVPAGYGY